MSLVLAIEADATAFRRVLGELRTEARSTANVLAGEFKRSGAETEKAHKGAARAAGRAAAEAEAAAKKASAAEEREAKNRAKIAEREAKAKAKLSAQRLREAERTEAEITRYQEREAEKRERLQEQRAAAGRRREARQARERARAAETEARDMARIVSRYEGRGRALGGQIFGATAAAAGSYASRITGDVRSVRERAAGHESALNTALLQTANLGATPNEIARSRAHIMASIRARRLNADVVVEAIGTAQESAGALNGDSAERRRAAIDATMEDVSFASLIDPNSVSGLVRVGALARGMRPEHRSELLRSFAGISFQGSVETDTMIRQGLRGLQEAWSVGTSGITDPAEASRRRLEIARDFAAQVQSAAASGVSTNVAANRTNSIPRALQNDERQNRLGQAFEARRRHGQMNAEQEAAFSAAFTRDEHGRYRMNREVSGRASDAARFFGTMFNNDATATRNFLGAHGGGGARQLMLTPDVNELVTYFATATDAHGRQVRQYDYVNELGRSTLSDRDVATMQAVRESEDSRNLNDIENRREQNLSDNTNAIVRLTYAFDGFAASHPFATPAATIGASALGTVVGGVAARGAGGLLGRTLAMVGLSGGATTAAALGGAGGSAAAGGAAAGGGAAATGAAGLGAVGAAGVALGGAGLLGGIAANGYAALTGRSATGRQLGTAERIGRGVASGLGPLGALLGAGDLVSAGAARTGQSMQGTSLTDLVRAVASGVAQGIQQSGGVPVRQDPLDRAAAGARGASGSPPPAP